MHGHRCACKWTTGPFLHNVGTEGQLAFLQPSAVSLGNLEKISDVQQSLADVVPKALGILRESRAQTNLQVSPRPSAPTGKDSFPARHALGGDPPSG